MGGLETTQKTPPVLAAAFGDQAGLERAVSLLQARRILPDFIGVYVGEDDWRDGEGAVHLLSVLAPSRLHAEIRQSFLECGAGSIGSAAEIRGEFGFVPHPGSWEQQEMKLPTGLEYPLARLRRRQERAQPPSTGGGEEAAS